MKFTHIILCIYIIPLTTAVPRKFRQRQQIPSRHKIASRNGRVLSNDIQDEFDNPVMIGPEEQRIDAYSEVADPPTPPVRKKRFHTHHHHHHNKRNDDNNGNGDNEIGNIRIAKDTKRHRDRAQQQFFSQGRDIRDPRDAAPPPAAPMPFGTVVSDPSDTKGNQNKYDSLLMDLPEYEDTEEQGFEQFPDPEIPTTTTPIRAPDKKPHPPPPPPQATTPNTLEVTTVYRAPTTEVLDLVGDEDDSGSGSHAPPSPRPEKPRPPQPPPSPQATTPSTIEVTTVYRAPTTEVLDLIEDEDNSLHGPHAPPLTPSKSHDPHSEKSQEPSPPSTTTRSHDTLSGRSQDPPPSRMSSKSKVEETNKGPKRLGSGKKDIKLVEEAGYRPEAKTRTTIFRGLIMNLESGKRVFTFYGISYAAPPVDTLRFKPPFPVESLSRDGPFEATRVNPPCFPSRIGRSSASAATVHNKEKGDNSDDHHRPNQNSMTVASEDCLYLNIWLPDKVVLDDQPGQSTLFPVLVWIHGEGFLSGMEKEDYKSAAEFVAETDIIVVTIQYRLGVFGFLHMGSTEYSGNMGLQDQVEALKWIEENIECFGGDPHAVTIMGHDIGASFVGYHLISKISPGYFNRAVMIGGVPMQPHMFHTKPHANRIAIDFATQIGCVNTKSLKSIMECLLNMDPVSIWEIQILMLQQGHNVLSFPFVPTEDGTVLSGTPVQLLEHGKGKTCPVLIGGSSNEGSLVLVNSVEGILPHDPTFVSYDKFLSIMRHILDDFADLEMDAINHQYKNWANLMDGYTNQVRAADAVADFYFTCPLRKFSDLWSARGLSTFHFSFSQQSSAKNRSRWMGAVHGDELDFFFGVPLRFPNMFSSEEQELSRHAMKVLENFIKTGDPNEDWERYGRETPHYADFRAGSTFYGTMAEPKFGPRMEQCAFWNDLFPKFASVVTGGATAAVDNRPINSYSSNPLGFDSLSGGVAGATNNLNVSMHPQSFSVDENCIVALHNCSSSNFAIYVN